MAVILEQYYLACLAHASYLVGDEEAGVAAVVDPQRDVDRYLADAARRGLAIRYVVLTHFHADFVAGHLELRERTGARIALGARAQAEYDFLPLSEGDALELGRVRLRVIETPGHTPEAISLVVEEEGRDAPHAVLTGDTLFIGDVGRPDLAVSGEGGPTVATLAGQLYDSLAKLLALPDETLVYPAHGAGSLCGRNLSSETVSTIGEQRRGNYALQPMGRDRFVGLVGADQPEAPAYFAFDAELNRRERSTLGQALARALRPRSLDELLRLRAEGATLLDVREASEYCAAHLDGSLAIGLGGKFASYAGALLARDRPIVLVATPGREEEAATRLGRIGFDHVAGFLAGGLDAAVARPDRLRQTARLTRAALARELERADPPTLLDVRTADERANGSIPGSLHLPLQALPNRLAELPRDRPIVAHCASGYRSLIAVSLLEREGFAPLADLLGGFAAWQAG